MVYAGFVVYIYALMRRPPERFAQAMAKMPVAAMIAMPFETLWTSARSGALHVGDGAPDFDLERLDKSARVRLSAFRGSRPVVLVFGSYT